MVGDNKSFSVSKLIGSRFPVHRVLNHSYRLELACAGGWERAYAVASETSPASRSRRCAFRSSSA